MLRSDFDAEAEAAQRLGAVPREKLSQQMVPEQNQRAGRSWAAVPGANSRPAACFTALRWVGLSHDVVFAHDVE